MRFRALLIGVALLAGGLAVTPTAVAKPLECGGKRVTVKGTSGDDTNLQGTNLKDVIHGRGGNDTIHGLDGNDIICGGGGGDVLIDTSGTNKLFGGSGIDDCTIRTGNTNKTCEGTAPTIGSLTASPSSPSDEDQPAISGTASPGSTVHVFLSATCSGTEVAFDDAEAFSTIGITVTVPTNATTAISANSTTDANSSACSASINYTHDDTDPNTPSITGSTPASPSSDGAPKIFGNAEAGSTVTLYGSNNCGAPVISSGSASSFASPGLAITANDNASTVLTAQAMDGVGNLSGCSNTFTYVHDDTGPSAPTGITSSPASPADDNQPEITGTAETGSTVQMYRSSDCSGNLEVQVTAANFASPGISVNVDDDTTTTFTVTATDAAGNVSDCSDPFTYAEQSSVFVSGFVGADENPGTPSAPKATLTSGIAAASALGVDVKVAGGQSYSSEPGAITMVDGVSLLGGYGCLELPCPWTRSLASLTTTIFPSTVDGIVIPSTVTSSTLLEGFDLRAKPGLSATKSTITVSGSPVIQHNRIDGAFNSAAGFATYTIKQPTGATGAPRILSNTITTGQSNGAESWGIYLTGSAIVDSNLINSDQPNANTCTAPVGYCGGIHLDSGASGSITNNVIFGMRISPVNAGIYDATAFTSMSVHSNLIDGGGNNTGTIGGVVIEPNASPTAASYRNNIIRSGSGASEYAVIEVHTGGTTHPSALTNNDLVTTGSVLYHFWNGTSGTDTASIAAINGFTFADDNLNVDCLVDATFHLGAMSSCIDAGTATSAPALDFEGDARPQDTLFDIGPDEVV